MEVFLLGHDYKYAVEQLLLTLYPEERPVYPAESSGADSVTAELRRGTKYAVALCRLVREGKSARGEARIVLPPDTERTAAVRLEQRIVKLAFYRAALALGREKPVWGCLTGVRPAKFLATLEKKDGLTPREAERALTALYDVDPARAALCARAAEAARAVTEELSPRDICLYIGIPFCPTRCAYCSFVSVDAPALLQRMPDYLASLEQEMSAAAEVIRENGLRIISVYIGGGTPTTLTAPELERLLTGARTLFDLSHCREFTVEAGRPDTVTPEKLRVLTEQGVQRVSVNPQTMSDEILAAIGRRHTVEEVYRAVDMVKDTSLSFNMDLIAGLPEDTPEGFADTLRAVLSLAPENVTVHTLALKKGSRFLTEGTALPDGEAVGAMLDDARAQLTAAGYAPYYLYRQKFMSGSFENVGWTKPGFANLYNICIMEELCSILAVGAGGSTKLVAPNGEIRRLMAPKYPREYMERIESTCESKKTITEFYKHL